MRLALLLLAACGSPLELRGDLAPMADEAHELAADYLPALNGWRVVIVAEPHHFICAGEVAVGCTSMSVAHEYAWIRLAMASDWTLADSSYMHEMTHVWLAATTGDGDAEHLAAVGP
jgi:hypothetical protein